MSAIDKLVALLQENSSTYADYLKKAIIETVLDINDEKTLNYIHTILMTAVTAETPKADC